MEKAWSVSDLVARWKARGLDVAEDAVEGMLDDATAWGEESAALTENPYDNMAMGVFSSYVPELKKKVDFNKDGA